MIQRIADGDRLDLENALSFPGHSISWASQGRAENEFCLGTEDGFVVLRTVEEELFPPMKLSEEAVNGVAFANGAMAVSTRREITFVTLPKSNSDEGATAIAQCGAHDVSATASGLFVAPAGPKGFLTVKVTTDPQQQFTLNRVTNRTMNFYKSAAIPSTGQLELTVFAARSNGIVLAQLNNGEAHQVTTLSHSAWDAVDVCALGAISSFPSMAALGRDGTILLIHDITHEWARKTTLRFPEIKGTPYSVFSARGSIFVLTSVALYILEGLAQGFLDGQPIQSAPIRASIIPMEAVDANLCGDKWLLIVLPDSVSPLDLDDLTGERDVGNSVQHEWNPVPEQLNSAWNSREDMTDAIAVS